MIDVYIALGSNVGDRNANIEQAISILARNPMIEMVAISTLIDNPAVSKIAQPNFLNGAVHIKTLLTAKELLVVTQEIEVSLGRVSKQTGDPRTIDLDILLYGSEIVAEDDLVIPHPMMHERPFVLDPMVEIAPNVQHPILGLNMQELSNQILGY